MVIIKEEFYTAEQPFLQTIPGVGSYNIPSSFESDLSKIHGTATFKGKAQTPIEERKKRRFPGPNHYDVLKVDVEHWNKEKAHGRKGTISKGSRKSDFLDLPSKGSTVGYWGHMDWGKAKGITKWSPERTSPKRDNPVSPASYFEKLPSSNISPSHKFGRDSRWKISPKEDIAPGYYSPEKYSSVSRKILISPPGKSYTVVDPTMKEKANVPGPNHYSPERSRRTPPSCQTRGFSLGARLTSFGMKSTTAHGTALYATLTQSSFNDTVGPGSYNISSTIGTGKSASMKGPYKESRTSTSPGPGEYESPNTWIKKTGNKKVFSGHHRLSQMIPSPKQTRQTGTSFTSSESPFKEISSDLKE